MMKESLALTRALYHAEDGEAYVVAGSGTLAMEMALINTVAPGERLLVVSQGYFGDRFIGVAKALGIHADCIHSADGERVSADELEKMLQGVNYKAVTVTHVDTSTGVAADVAALVPVVKKAGALFLLDGVCASAALEEDMSRDFDGNGARIDLVLTASQKAIGAPPGLAIVVFGPEALKARAELEKVGSYYCDIQNWRPIMQEPSKYFATHPVNMMYAYHAAMKIVEREGLEQRYKRHTAIGKAIRAALRSLGLDILAHDETGAMTLSCAMYPSEDFADVDFRDRLRSKGLIVAGLLGSLAGKGFRIGHMGNTTKEELLRAVRILGETLNEVGITAETEAAARTFSEVYDKQLT
jgi:aspartate aminotransferase-like enzyme